jgi:hypothetical protein
MIHFWPRWLTLQNRRKPIYHFERIFRIIFNLKNPIGHEFPWGPHRKLHPAKIYQNHFKNRKKAISGNHSDSGSPLFSREINGEESNHETIVIELGV